MSRESFDWNTEPQDTVFIVGQKGTIRPIKGHFATVKGLTVSGDCRRAAIDGVYLRVDLFKQIVVSETAGLFYSNAESDRENVQLVSSLEQTESYLFGVSDGAFQASWSSSGGSLAFEHNQRLFVYDLSRGESKFLAIGRRPAWSPDGKWIGCQGLDGTPMLRNLSAGQSQALVKGVKCLWSLKWSPDSKFAIFTEDAGTGQTVLKVCRLRDRATVAFYWSGARFNENRFAWVTRSVASNLLAAGESIP